MTSVHQTTAKRIEALTSLRFLAAFIVVSFHFGLNPTLGHTVLIRFAPGIFTSGPEMVTLFFVLSGFVLTLAYADKANFSTADYFVNRVARIAPAYYLALAIMLLADIRHGLDGIDPVALLLNLTFLQSWIPTYPQTLNTPAWSLSVEVAFYLSFPLVLRYALRARPQNLLALSLAVWALTQLAVIIPLNTSWYRGFPSASHDLLYFFPPVHLGSFLLGVCGARLLATGGDDGPQQFGRWRSEAKTIGICLLILGVLEVRPLIEQGLDFRLPFAGGLFAPLFLLLILQLARGQDFLARALSLPPFVALGRASYSFYILQAPVYRLFVKVVSAHLPQNADLQFWLFVVGLGAISMLSQKFVEVPAANLLRRFRPAALLPQTPHRSISES